jgi:hypothetical protein
MGAHKAEVFALEKFYYMPVGSRPDPNDPLAIPAFLDRRVFEDDGGELVIKLKDQTMLLNEINGSGPRVWAPMRKMDGEYMREKALEKARNLQIWVDYPNNPVQVVTTKRENLQLHDNFEAFMKMHDFEDYPFVRSFSAGEINYVQVKAPVALTGLSDELKDMDRPKVETVEKNGVKRPKANSVTGIAWAMFDKMDKVEEFKATVFEQLKANGMNPSTIRTQFAHWKKFNGISK